MRLISPPERPRYAVLALLGKARLHEAWAEIDPLSEKKGLYEITLYLVKTNGCRFLAPGTDYL